MRVKYLEYTELPSYYADWKTDFVKFKEFFYSKDEQKYLPTHGDSFNLINMNCVEHIIINGDMVQIMGMVGKFFV